MDDRARAACRPARRNGISGLLGEQASERVIDAKGFARRKTRDYLRRCEVVVVAATVATDRSSVFSRPAAIQFFNRGSIGATLSSDGLFSGRISHVDVTLAEARERVACPGRARAAKATKKVRATSGSGARRL